MRIPGARFPIALPTGEHAALIPGSHIITHAGSVALPGFDVLFLDITNNGGVFKIAGQAQPNDHRRGAWEWAHGSWHHVSSEAPGSYPVIYDSAGNLHIATPARNGSQGWRYQSERTDIIELVTGDDTLNPFRRVGRALGLTDLWEYSHFNGVTIGQGDPPIGCHVLIDGTRRVLERGDCHFIRVRYRNGLWAISMTKLAEREAVMHWMLRPQLAALPLADTENEPDQPEEPEEPPMSDYPPELEDQRALVVEVRNTLFPDLIGKPLNDPAKAMLWTKHIAWRLRQHGVGLVKAKPGSSNNVGGFTSDIVALKNGVHWDIQIDGHDGGAFPTWALEDNPDNYPPIAARWVPAVNPGGVPPDPEPPDPDEPDEPEPPSDDVQRLILAELRKLNAHLGVR